MNFKFKNYKEEKYLPKFQEGGEMPADQGAPVEQAPVEQAPEGGDPMQQILQAAAQAVQTQDCNVAMQVCQVLIEMASGGAQAPEQEPVYRKGGRLVRFIKK